MLALCCERLHLEPQGGFYLACGYYYGENGETQDYAEAARWFEIAAGAGHVKAIDILKRVTAAKNAGNYKQEAALLREVFELTKDPELKGIAEYQPGYLYTHGLGVPQDLKQADYWIRRTADNGNETALEKIEFD